MSGVRGGEGQQRWTLHEPWADGPTRHCLGPTLV